MFTIFCDEFLFQMKLIKKFPYHNESNSRELMIHICHFSLFSCVLFCNPQSTETRNVIPWYVWIVIQFAYFETFMFKFFCSKHFLFTEFLNRNENEWIFVGNRGISLWSKPNLLFSEMNNFKTVCR